MNIWALALPSITAKNKLRTVFESLKDCLRVISRPLSLMNLMWWLGFWRRITNKWLILVHVFKIYVTIGIINLNIIKNRPRAGQTTLNGQHTYYITISKKTQDENVYNRFRLHRTHAKNEHSLQIWKKCHKVSDKTKADDQKKAFLQVNMKEAYSDIPHTFRHLHGTSSCGVRNGGCHAKWQLSSLLAQHRQPGASLPLPHDQLHSQLLPALRPLIGFRPTGHSHKSSKVQHINSKSEPCTDKSYGNIQCWAPQQRRNLDTFATLYSLQVLGALH